MKAVIDMGKEFVVNSLEDMCALMCDNAIPTQRRRKKTMNIGDEVRNIYTRELSLVLVPDYKNTDCEDQMVILSEGVACPQIVQKSFYELTGENEPFILELVQELAKDIGAI